MYSSTEPREESEVDEAEPVGESVGEPALELEVVEGMESRLSWRRSALLAGSAELLMVGQWFGGGKVVC